MSEKERLVRFKLLGQEFAFYTGASEEEMDEILVLVRKMLEENVSGPPGTLPASKVAVMACLNLGSKFMKLKRDFEEYKIETDGRINTLNTQLEELFSLERKRP